MKRICFQTLVASIVFTVLRNGSKAQDFVFNQSNQVLMHENWASWHDGANWHGFVAPGSTSWVNLDDRNPNFHDPPPIQPYRIFFGDYFKDIFLGGSHDHFILGGEAHVDWLRMQNGHWILDFNSWDKPGDPQGHDTTGSLKVGGADRPFGDIFDVGSAKVGGTEGNAIVEVVGPGSLTVSVMRIGLGKSDTAVLDLHDPESAFKTQRLRACLQMA